MPLKAIRNTYGLDREKILDHWLRFSPAVQQRYNAEQSVERVRELRRAIYFGLALYNVYNVTSIFLLPDVLTLSFIFRLAILSPTALILSWLIGRTSAEAPERLILSGIICAYLLPLLLFWLTSSPLGLFTIGELPLTIVYANIVLMLRFRYAMLFTAICAIATSAALTTKPGLDPSLQLAFAVQILTACAFGIYANYRTELRRCVDYLAKLEADLQAMEAEEERQKSHAMSRTDALTGLPNRLYLQERLTEWFKEPCSITVMMIDIDFFKPYNDALGHQEGDRCLREIAQFFAATGDAPNLFCARYGGEEFTLAMQGASEIEAVRIARLLLQGVESLAIVHPSRPDDHKNVTISIGIAHKAAGIFEIQSGLLGAADRALYSAKQQGRNRFILDGETSASRLPAIA